MEGDVPLGPFGAMRLGVGLRRYQAQLLDAAARPEATADGRLHLVAPPGSGKTLIGLELARRLARPTVVFAPTTTIVEQWRRELRHFVDVPEGLLSTDPEHPSVVTVLTYQVISTPAEAGDLLLAAARAGWCEQLVRDNRVPDPAAADARLEALQQADGRSFRRELTRRATRLRRAMLREGEDPHRFLHPNARRLVEALTAAGVGTIVLDECHHLLDYWAVVVADLAERLGTGAARAEVVGLTATLPSPGTGREEETYLDLLGDVDFEVPTPALVKEGELAPWRDLVAFVRPTPREQAYLDDVQSVFEAAIGGITTSEEFLQWVVSSAVLPALEQARAPQQEQDGSPGGAGEEEARLDAWAAWLRGHPRLSISVLRCLHRLGVPLPAGVPVPVEGDAPPGLEDWCLLLERYALDHLAVAADGRGQLAELRRALGPFGLTLTERGLRQGRSSGDLVLALSAAKSEAAARIVAEEHAVLGERLRAVVVSEADAATTAPARLTGVLDDDAGTARRVLAALVAVPGAHDTRPVLVTGRGVFVSPLAARDLADWCNVRLAERRVDAWCEPVGTDVDHVLELVGHGSAWATRLYVRLVTEALDAGVVRCLVATRALVGEGWNSPAANTLVDLSGVTTATSAQQLRGRTLRLDPEWPGKVAHNWDVVCVAPAFEGGLGDLDRFRRRHRRLWGLGDDGAVTRGAVHVDARLADELARDARGADFDAATARAFAAVDDRVEWRSRWGVGEPYRNAWASELRAAVPPRLAVRTRGVQRAARRAALARSAPLLAGSGAALALHRVVELAALPAVAVALALSGVGLATARLGADRRSQPGVDSLRDLAAAVREALVESGLAPRLAEASIEVDAAADDAVRVSLASEPPVAEDDARAFVDAVRALLGPVGEPRYLLVARRTGPGRSLYAVPAVLGARRDLADAFAAAWRRHVGRGEVVYTYSDEGRRLLLAARAQQPLVRRQLAFERWW